MKQLNRLFQNNKKWAEEKLKQDPEYFSSKSQSQEPRYLWIGCSDSRVPANEIIGLEAGELVVHRNIANLFPHTDFNCLSVLEFAVDLLQIEHVIVCGHYGCGGIKAAMQDHQLGLVDNWLRHIRDTYALGQGELEGIANEEDKYRRLVELNVLQQVLNICHTTIVQGAWARKHPLTIHGWVYDIATGLLKDLNCCLSGVEQVETIYRIKH